MYTFTSWTQLHFLYEVFENTEPMSVPFATYNTPLCSFVFRKMRNLREDWANLEIRISKLDFPHEIYLWMCFTQRNCTSCMVFSLTNSVRNLWVSNSNIPPLCYNILLPQAQNVLNHICERVVSQHFDIQFCSERTKSILLNFVKRRRVLKFHRFVLLQKHFQAFVNWYFSPKNPRGYVKIFKTYNCDFRLS